MDFRYTRHQVARGTRPDAASGDTRYLFKKTAVLRLTYQIRLLTFLATERDSRLIIRTSTSNRLSRDLKAFVKENAKFVKVERVA